MDHFRLYELRTRMRPAAQERRNISRGLSRRPLRASLRVTGRTQTKGKKVRKSVRGRSRGSLNGLRGTRRRGRGRAGRGRRGETRRLLNLDGDEPGGEDGEEEWNAPEPAHAAEEGPVARDERHEDKRREEGARATGPLVRTAGPRRPREGLSTGRGKGVRRCARGR